MKHEFSVGLSLHKIRPLIYVIVRWPGGELRGGILCESVQIAFDAAEALAAGAELKIPDRAIKAASQIAGLGWEGDRAAWAKAAKAELKRRAAAEKRQAEIEAERAEQEAARVARWEAGAPERAARAAIRAKRRAANDWMLDCGFTPQEQIQQTADELERRIVRARRAGATLRQIGDKLGITAERVRAIWARAMRKDDYNQRTNRVTGMSGPVPKFLAAKAEIFDITTTSAKARRSIRTLTLEPEGPKPAPPSRMAALREPELMI